MYSDRDATFNGDGHKELDLASIFSDTGAMRYPGGKNGGGAYQKMINQMPPHRVYVEPFLGSGAVMRNKRPALLSIGLDLDAATVAEFNDTITIPGAVVRCGDALGFIRSYDWQGDELIYCDPPYLMETRASREAIYRVEFFTREQHSELLSLLDSLPCMVMLSGYWSELYCNILRPPKWRHISFDAMTRGGGRAREYVWMNFPEPVELHDARYLGDNRRERERIKRRKTRWLERLKRMPARERYAMLAAIEELKAAGASPIPATPDPPSHLTASTTPTS